MRNLFGTIGAAIGLVALAALFLGHALLVYPGWEAIADVLKPFDAAAWVQAIGSITAILASAGFVRWQHELEQERNREADRETRRRKLDVVVELARATAHSIQYVRGYFPSREAVHDIADERKVFDAPVADDLGSLLSSIPLHELDDPKIANEVLILTRNAQQMRGMVSKLFRFHREMDARAFSAAFEGMDLCTQAAERSHKAIRARADELVRPIGHQAALP